jgi:hypothetical protein
MQSCIEGAVYDALSQLLSQEDIVWVFVHVYDIAASNSFIQMNHSFFDIRVRRISVCICIWRGQFVVRAVWLVHSCWIVVT